MGSSSRRLQVELAAIKNSVNNSYNRVDYKESDLHKWTILLVPEKEPYSKGAFKVRVEFPSDYPFKPPKITFETKIFHPNVDEEGRICLAIVSSDNWKPATRIDQVMLALVDMINDPQLDHPLRADIAEEYRNDRKKFNKACEDHIKKHAEKRPDV